MAAHLREDPLPCRPTFDGAGYLTCSEASDGPFLPVVPQVRLSLVNRLAVDSTPKRLCTTLPCGTTHVDTHLGSLSITFSLIRNACSEISV